jgi:hypothetical protein
MLLEDGYYVANPIVDLGVQLADSAKFLQSRALLFPLNEFLPGWRACVVKLPGC